MDDHMVFIGGYNAFVIFCRKHELTSGKDVIHVFSRYCWDVVPDNVSMIFIGKGAGASGALESPRFKELASTIGFRYSEAYNEGIT